MIYLIATSCDSFCKIGVAQNPHHRLLALQGGCPLELRIVATREGGFELEKSVHKAADQFRLRGEWFQFSSEIVEIFQNAEPLKFAPKLKGHQDVLDETYDLAREAFKASGCKNHTDFVALFGGAIALRTFRGWLGRECPASPLTLLALREFIAGWRPSL